MPEKFSLKNVLFDLALLIGLPIVLTVAFGIYSSARPNKIPSDNTPAVFGLSYEDVSFTTADGVRIAGWFVPKKGGEAEATIIVLHGYPADKGDILSRAVFLADTYDLLYIDFRYFGESGGHYTTVGAKEVNDVLAAAEYARSRGAKRIGLYGFSMGAAAALMAVPRSEHIDAVVAEASYARLELMTQQLYRYFGPLKRLLVPLTGVVAGPLVGVDIYRTSPADAVAGTQLPVLLIHGRYDKVIPFENAELIALNLKDDPNAEFWFTDSEVHGEASKEFTIKVSEFFAKHL